jgi:hypothetical protein
MKKVGLFFPMLLLVFGLGTALAQEVNVEWDPDTDFTKYGTYKWEEGTPLENPLLQQEVVSVVESELSAEGLVKVETDPNVFVTTHGSVKEEIPGMTRFGDHGAGWGRSKQFRTPPSYTKGTVVVDIWDANRKALVWQGTATNTLTNDTEKNSSKIREVVVEMFKKYPPQRE